MGHFSGKRRTEIEREISYCIIVEKGGGQKREQPPQSKTDRFLLNDTHTLSTMLNKEATKRTKDYITPLSSPPLSHRLGIWTFLQQQNFAQVKLCLYAFCFHDKTQLRLSATTEFMCEFSVSISSTGQDSAQ